MGYSGEDRRQHTEVYDRPAESGIKLISVIATLTLLMIGGFGTWIGTNIEAMKDDFRVVFTNISNNELRIERNEKDISENKSEIKKISSKIVESNFKR